MKLFQRKQPTLVTSTLDYQPLFNLGELDRFGSHELARAPNNPSIVKHVHTPLHQTEKAEGLIEVPSTEIITSVPGFEAWLPFVAPAYNISADRNDYFFRPVPAIISDLPNRNGVGFSAAELIRWNVRAGTQAYKSWIGKPVHVEHGSWHPDPKDPDPRLAIGVIVDVAMTPLVGFGGNKLWKVVMLAAIDRTKDKPRAKRMEAGELNTFSMGALVDGYLCSYCGHEVGTCSHIDKDDPLTFYDLRGVLVYKLCVGVEGVELSSVEDPAYGIATSDVVHIRY